MGNVGRPRVLVIDDDPIVREVVSEMLVSFGCECDAAAGGADGVARFARGSWDLVLTDLSMPGMSGWEVVETIQRQAPSIPIGLITGLVDSEVASRAAERGIALIPKPFRPETLRAAVAKALGEERLWGAP